MTSLFANMDIEAPVPQVERALPTNVWLVQQERSREQRAGRYREGSNHTQKMPPDLARRMIQHAKLEPGALVVDTFAGSGTSLVEAIELGHNAFGVEFEMEHVYWSILPNLDLAWRRGAAGNADVRVGDARAVPMGDNTADLWVGSPPYGGSDPSRDSGGRDLAERGDECAWAAYLLKTGAHGGSQRTPLSDGSLSGLRWGKFCDEMPLWLGEVRRILKPGRYAMVATREFWDSTLYDLPGEIISCARRVGLNPVDKIYAIEAHMDHLGVLRSRATAHRHLIAAKQLGRPAGRGIPVVTTVAVLRKEP